MHLNNNIRMATQTFLLSPNFFLCARQSRPYSPPNQPLTHSRLCHNAGNTYCGLLSRGIYQSLNLHISVLDNWHHNVRSWDSHSFSETREGWRVHRYSVFVAACYPWSFIDSVYAESQNCLFSNFYFPQRELREIGALFLLNIFLVEQKRWHYWEEIRYWMIVTKFNRSTKPFI